MLPLIIVAVVVLTISISGLALYFHVEHRIRMEEAQRAHTIQLAERRAEVETRIKNGTPDRRR